MFSTIFFSRSMLLNRRSTVVVSLIASLFFFASMSPAPVAAGECGGGDISVSSVLPTIRVVIVECKIEEEEPAPVVEVEDDDVCITPQTRIAIKNDVVSIFSNFVDGNPNGMLITELPLSAIRAVTDEEKALNTPILVVSKDSEFAPGFHVDLYWFDNHYGVVVTGTESFYDDTSDCANF